MDTIVSPLPFYSDISMQQHRKDYAFGVPSPVVIYKNILMPFQFCIPFGGDVNEVLLFNFETGTHVSVRQQLRENGLVLKFYTDFINIIYPGIFPVAALSSEGIYYLGITVGGHTYYSDLFVSCNNVDNMLCLEYGNSTNLITQKGLIDFSNNFKFKCYLDTQLGRPEYEFEEEATERMGYTFVESQISKKLFKFTFLAPEFLCDALRIVRLCDSKTVTNRGAVYEALTFAIEPKWLDQGDLASVEAEFETDNIISSLGGFKPTPLGGDFLGADFSDDFSGGLPSTVDTIVSASNSTSMSHVYVNLSEPARSAISVSVNFTFTGGSSGAYTITINKNGTSGQSTLFSKTIASIDSATVGKNASDNTTYRVIIT